MVDTIASLLHSLLAAIGLLALADPAASVKDAAFTQHQHPFYGSAKDWKAWGYSLRTDRWRYTEWRAISDGSVMARELYDHESDPLETKNLADEAGREEVLGTLAERLARQFGPKGHQR